MRGSQQEAGDVERVTFTVSLPNAQEWADMLSLVTTKYHVHAPLGGSAVIDVVRGPGAGALVVSGLGSTTAILVALRRTLYLPSSKSQGTADFLITAVWT